MAEKNQDRPFEGIPVATVLDRQHEEIKKKRQLLREAIVQGRGMEQILSSARSLIETTREHFASEEQAMVLSRYLGLEKHKALHSEMMNSVEAIFGDLEKRRITSAMELMQFFDVRMMYHLEHEDGAFGRELQNLKK